MVMQPRPGDKIIGGILSGQVDPFQLAPAMPWESPVPFVPRYLARQLWPGGFPLPTLAAALPTVPTSVPQAPVQVAAPPAVQVASPPAVQVAAPAPAVNQVFRPAASGGDPILVRSQRVRISERSGM